MNERIKELAEQAVNAVDNPFPGNPLNDELEKMYIPDCFAEKFAELIVRECAKVAVFNHSNMIATADVAGYMAAGRSTAARLIKEHFGVEE